MGIIEQKWAEFQQDATDDGVAPGDLPGQCLAFLAGSASTLLVLVDAAREGGEERFTEVGTALHVELYDFLRIASRVAAERRKET